VSAGREASRDFGGVRLERADGNPAASVDRWPAAVYGGWDPGRRAVTLYELRPEHRLGDLHTLIPGGFRMGTIVRALAAREYGRNVQKHVCVLVTDCASHYVIPGGEHLFATMKVGGPCRNCWGAERCAFEPTAPLPRGRSDRRIQTFLPTSCELADLASAVKSTRAGSNAATSCVLAVCGGDYDAELVRAYITEPIGQYVTLFADDDTRKLERAVRSAAAGLGRR